ncbi:hydrogenase 2 operon protein HybA [Desulfothermus sp.]
MSVSRRGFLKTVVGGTVALGAGTLVEDAKASKTEKLPPNAVGILYDSNLCIGCQSCMVACKKANNLPYEHTGDQKTWDNPIDLSSKTYNIIKMYKEGDKFAFIKRQCMHCLEPACAAACPVTALHKDEKTGIVTYDPSACIGCRYCQVACPYNIPKFEWDSPFPQIRKCQLCYHLLEKGGYPACCAVCPTGASLFGPVEKLREEAHRRLMMKPGEYYEFPVNHIESGKTKVHKAKPYIKHIYGLDELGGSQCMILAGIDFVKLGLPELRKKSYVEDLEGVSMGLYKYLLYPIAAFGGLAYLVKKRGVHD